MGETLCYDEGKFPLASELAKLSDKKIATLLEVAEWIDCGYLQAMVDVMKEGAKKYEKDNWKLGTKFSRRTNSAMRHLLQFARGIDIDEETKCHHAAMVGVNMMMVFHWLVNQKGEDDRPSQSPHPKGNEGTVGSAF
jgi:hypothetical protein